MCANIGSPAVIKPPHPPLEGRTNRERLATNRDACSNGCHALIDPLGFAFEGFDGQGRARDADGGHPIDASGSFPFRAGTSSFADARELSLKLAEDDHAYACYGQRLAGFALQREMVADDAALIDDLTAAARGASLKDIALALVQHPAFRIRHEPLP